MIDLPPSLLSEEKIAKIESRHNDLCIMYGGEPWDESCVEDGEQAHMDRAALLAHVRAQRPAVTREQIAGEILRSRFEYAPGNIELSNNCDDDIEALKAADAILALSAHLSPQGAGERGWRPISEASQDGTHYLLAMTIHNKSHNTVPIRCGYFSDRKCFWMVDGMSIAEENITHFMPLPAPPQAPEGT